MPQNQKDEQVVRKGLVLYQYLNQTKGNAVVNQKGRNNNAGLSQNGKGNLGVIHQDGKGHNATLDQKGKNNAYGIFQYGARTDAAVTQRGKGNAGMLFQWGWWGSMPARVSRASSSPAKRGRWRREAATEGAPCRCQQCRKAPRAIAPSTIASRWSPSPASQGRIRARSLRGRSRINRFWQYARAPLSKII